MTDFAKLTRNQRRAVDRATDERKDGLAASYAQINIRDRTLAIKFGLAIDGVDVGDGLAQLSDTYRGRV